MLNFLKNVFAPSPKPDFKELISKGAIIVDVRTSGEFAGGHLKKSINMPVDSLPVNYEKLPKNKPIILCCASGMRSSSAKRMLKSKGFTDIHNGGNWMELQSAVTK